MEQASKTTQNKWKRHKITGKPKELVFEILDYRDAVGATFFGNERCCPHYIGGLLAEAAKVYLEAIKDDGENKEELIKSFQENINKVSE